MQRRPEEKWLRTNHRRWTSRRKQSHRSPACEQVATPDALPSPVPGAPVLGPLAPPERPTSKASSPAWVRLALVFPWAPLRTAPQTVACHPTPGERRCSAAGASVQGLRDMPHGIDIEDFSHLEMVGEN